jgi:2-(1,2-epoxy-1,2-dihydrophenyl)acetyl-CoA isomerase
MSVRVDFPVAGVGRILINRPAKRNAIDYAVREQMYHALLALQANPDCRAVVLGGVDGVFSAGGDLDSMGGLDEAGARERMQHIQRLCLLLAHLPLPVVSAVEGFCAGAAVGMALLGDYIVVGKATKIIFPFMGLGLVPDWGAMLTLPRRIGVAQARRLMTAGKVISGEEAYDLGFADENTGDGDVMATAIAQAGRMACLPQAAYAHFKARLMHPSLSIEQELQREADHQAVLLPGPEFALGYAAALRKTSADFLQIPREVKP